MNLSETSTYSEIKEKVIAYERLNTTWSREKVYSELGAVTPCGTDSGGAAPMAVNQIKGKSKGKGQKGKQQKGKGKDKGTSKGKGKGKPQQSGRDMVLPPKEVAKPSQRHLM